jgi:hypothetical protein
MKLLRSIFWLLVVALLVAFSMSNWYAVKVTIWANLVVDAKLPALVIGAYLLGMVPTWLIYRATRWRLSRRITTLENALGAPSAALSSSQLDAAAHPSSEAL